MRIISGSRKKKKLFSLDGQMTRPTSDRVREAVFNMIGITVKDKTILDLYAGTGAMGIEALSREAGFALFLDISPKAIGVINKNLAACQFQDRARVFKWDIVKNLNCIRQMPPFEIVFIDPPYREPFIPPTLAHLKKGRILAEDALIILETSIKSPPLDDKAFQLELQKKYGQTQITFLRFNSQIV